MATFSKKVSAFQTNFAAFLQAQAKETGLSVPILKEIMSEQMSEEAQPIKMIETIVLNAAAKATAIATEVVKVIPVKAAAAAPPRKTGAAVGGAGSPPTPYNEVVKAAKAAPPPAATAVVAVSASTMSSPALKAWGEEMADMPPWKVTASRECTSFTRVPYKKDPKTYTFHLRSISEIHKSLFYLRKDKHPKDELKEWLHALKPEEVSAWLEDTKTFANYNSDTNKFTIATIIYKFITWFEKHNLTRNVLKHLGYCISHVMIPEPPSSEKTCFSCEEFSPGDKPTEEILREVAMIQAIQGYVLTRVAELFEKADDKGPYKITGVTKTPDHIKISFESSDAVEKFSSAMKWDWNINGAL